MFNFSAIFIPVPFWELVRIWSSFLSILLCSKYLQSNFEVPGPLRSLSLGLIPTVIAAIFHKWFEIRSEVAFFLYFLRNLIRRFCRLKFFQKMNDFFFLISALAPKKWWNFKKDIILIRDMFSFIFERIENTTISCWDFNEDWRNISWNVDTDYRTGAIITRGLYIYYPIFEVHFFVFKEFFFQKFLKSCLWLRAGYNGACTVVITDSAI